ncbi:uncharacterized protein LOC133178261 [Saccostrea echinata]|uniref:uncharacterized protein LOC133178261 n=1 Tax=Saccostrea echinata TaxID=191078 RepID=UPI002A80949F|nr:uncharacterized protein LOC133178261 [Saccostrea echinata]
MDPRTSAQDVMRCDLCETALVQMHCDTCLDNLCTACVGVHFSADLSIQHKVVYFKDRKFTHIYLVCKTHNNKEQCQMYCDRCNIPVCNKCLASNQHQGHKLSKILQILSKKKVELIKYQTELKDTIYPTYQDIVSDIVNRMSQLEKEYGDLSTAITKHGEDWHREIHKIVKKLKNEVDEMNHTQSKTLQKHLKEIKQKMINIKEKIELVDVAVDSPYVHSGKINREQLPVLFGVLSSISLFQEKNGYNIQTSPEAGSFPPVKQPIDVPAIVTTIDTGYKYLYSVACLNDEEIWTRGNDSTMKLYSINQGTLVKSITTKSGNWPHDIAVTKSGDLVYTDYRDRTVNIVKNEKIEEVIRLQNWRPHSVCITSSGDYLVSMDSDDNKQTKVVRYSGSTEKQTIQFEDIDKPTYFSETRYITQNRNLDICVSDSGAVVVVDQVGKLRFRYIGHTPAPKKKPFSPRGITTDSQSHSLTADDNNDCVHIIDQNGQFLHYIDCGMKIFYGLCTDKNYNLFFVQKMGKKVKKIRYQTRNPSYAL